MITLHKESNGYREGRDSKTEKYTEVEEFSINPECIQAMHDYRNNDIGFYRVNNNTLITSVSGEKYICRETQAAIKKKIVDYYRWRSEPKCIWDPRVKTVEDGKKSR